jgi:ligand-binding sensor domain-containing protein
LINQLATDEINDLAFANPRLWIGTNQGLTIFDQKKDRWKRLSMSNGLSDEVITTIGLEDTVAWIGTPRGLCTVRTADYMARRQKLAPRQNI